MSIKDFLDTVMVYLLIPAFLVLALIIGEDPLEEYLIEEDPLVMAYEYDG